MVASEPTPYDLYVAAAVQAAIDDPRPSVLHEDVMARLEARISFWKERHPADKKTRD